MNDIRSVGNSFAGVAWVGLRSFLVAFALVMLWGIVLACISYSYLAAEHWVYGLIGVLVALFETVVTAFVFSAKRAAAMAGAYGCGTLGLGRTVTRIVFDRILGTSVENQRGNALAQGMERLPLAQAETLLTRAVQRATGEASGGWLRRAIQRKLLEVVGKVTLARFRTQNAEQGGVDIRRVQEQLEQSIDTALVKKLRDAVRLWTLAVLVGLPFVIASQTIAVLMLLRSHH